MKISELNTVTPSETTLEKECDRDESYILINYQANFENEPTTQKMPIHELSNIIKYDLQNTITPIVMTNSDFIPFTIDGNGDPLYITKAGPDQTPIVVYKNGQLGYYGYDGSFAAIGE